MSGIVWLASYPKSGNTWFRILIANLLSDSDEPVDINKLHKGSIAVSRAVFADFTGIESSDLTPEEIDSLRPEVYVRMAEESQETLFVKVHDAYTYLPDGRPLIPVVEAKVIYIIRNPLDVAVSYSHHSSLDIDSAITLMGDPDRCFYGEPDRLHGQLRQKLLDWSGHVESWVDRPGFPVHVVRYEDMLANTVDTFSRAARFIGLPSDWKRVRQAVRFSAFPVLQKQEEERGFVEKPPGATSFFREGRVGGWHDRLTGDQAKRITQAHGRVMKRFGYLD